MQTMNEENFVCYMYVDCTRIYARTKLCELKLNVFFTIMEWQGMNFFMIRRNLSVYNFGKQRALYWMVCVCVSTFTAYLDKVYYT